MHKYCPPAIGIFGFFILLFGVICSLYIIPLIESVYFGEGVLRNGSFILNMFENSQMPRQLKIYLFDVVNPDEIYDGRKPIIKEIGPYVYDQHKLRTIEKIDENANIIEFFETTFYIFNSTESEARSEDDFVTTVNIPLIGTLLKMEGRMAKLTVDVDKLIRLTFPGIKNAFTKVKIKDFLFEGIKIACVHNTSFVCTSLDDKPAQIFRKSGDDIIFSLFNHINGTEIGPFEMYTGEKETVRGTIISFRKRSKLFNWKPSGECNTIRGTNIQLFPTLPVVAYRLYTFFYEFCRSIFLVFEEEKQVSGVPIYTYIINKELFDVSRANECFCKRSKFQKDSLYCNPKGTMDLTACQNFSLTLSLPHFYLGDSHLNDYVTGLRAEKKLHESFVSIEPRSGISLTFAIRFQINIKLKRFESLTKFAANVSEGIFPILWTEDVQELDQELINDYFLDRIFHLKLLLIGKYSLVAFGVLVMLFSVALLVYQQQRTVSASSNNRRDKNASLLYNVNLYPQMVNKNVSDRFIRRSRRQIKVSKRL